MDEGATPKAIPTEIHFFFFFKERRCRSPPVVIKEMSMQPLYGVHFRGSQVDLCSVCWASDLRAWWLLPPCCISNMGSLSICLCLCIFTFTLLRKFVFFPWGDLPGCHILLYPQPPGLRRAAGGTGGGKGFFPLGLCICFLLHGECSFHFKHVVRQAWSIIKVVSTIYLGVGRTSTLSSWLFQLLLAPYGQNHWSHWPRVESSQWILGKLSPKASHTTILRMPKEPGREQA